MDFPKIDYGVPTGVIPREPGRKSVQQLYDEHHAGEGFPALKSEPSKPALKDSGERREVSTGAVRDRSAGKGRFDLLPLFGLYSMAAQMERGAAKYSERNWEQGMPLSWFADAALRHFLKFLAGFDDEPHLDAAQWNLVCLAEGRERIKRGLWPAEMDDLPKTFAGLQPGF